MPCGEPAYNAASPSLGQALELSIALTAFSHVDLQSAVSRDGASQLPLLAFLVSPETPCKPLYGGTFALYHPTCENPVPVLAATFCINCLRGVVLSVPLKTLSNLAFGMMHLFMPKRERSDDPE